MWSEEFRQGEKFNVSESTPSDDYNRLLDELNLDLNPWYRPSDPERSPDQEAKNRGLTYANRVVLPYFAKGITKLISEKTYSGE